MIRKWYVAPTIFVQNVCNVYPPCIKQLTTRNIHFLCFNYSITAQDFSRPHSPWNCRNCHLIDGKLGKSCDWSICFQSINQQSIRTDRTDRHAHKVLTYIEYRAKSGVFRTIDPPCVLSPHQRGYTLAGGGGSIFRKTPDIVLALTI